MTALDRRTLMAVTIDGIATPTTLGAKECPTMAQRLRRNDWALSGDWTIKRDAVLLNKPRGRIAYRFHARDIHLVMGPPRQEHPRNFAC